MSHRATGTASGPDVRTLRIPVDGFRLAEAAIGSQHPPAEAEWIDAPVPGGVHEALLTVGRIEHPYYDRNEEKVRWVEDRDWWYRTSFDAPVDLAADERLRLVFHGLDTVVDVWLNGVHLGSHENMFRPAEYDVTDAARARNDLVLRFRPPLAGLEEPPSVAEMNERLAGLFAQMGAGGDDGDEAAEGGAVISPELSRATLRRKATFSWGWDFGPRVPSVGIWRPVELVRERRAAISGHHVRTQRIEGGAATVTVSVEADAFAVAGELAAHVELVSPAGVTTTLDLPLSGGGGSAQATIPDAQLWWTHDLGEPALYDVVISLTEDGEQLDRIEDRIGLRTIEIDRSPDPEGGRLFRFVLNGVPIFARGAAWLPASMMVGSVPEERYRALVSTARDGNMNMLRIWGGGIYEHDAFYRATDELGVLVWHDFMFACVDYPSEDPVLQAEVAAEAAYQVARLRNRASMALWSGNNEVQLIHGFAYQSYEPGNWGWDFFHRILPDTVAELDGAVPYWPGSPWGEDPSEGFMAVNGVLDGDRHAWEVWHGFDFGAGGGPYDSIGEARHYRRYANDRGKFISEFGIHASPVLSTLEKWIPQEGLSVHSASFDAHNKDHPKNKGDALMEIITGVPSNMREYVDFTMVSQAEGMKFGIEHYRRRAPHCSGTIVWQFNDVWPGFSWSLVDYEVAPKAGYYFTRRAYAPVVASFVRSNDELALWVSNSSASTVETTAVVSVAPFAVGGTPAIEERVPLVLEPGASREVWRLPGSDGALSADHYAWVQSEDGAFPANRLLLAEVKDVPFGEGEVESEVTATGDTTATVRIRSRGYNYFVHVAHPEPGVRFSDNYLDLRDGDEVTIEVSGLPAGFDPAALEVQRYAGA